METYSKADVTMVEEIIKVMMACFGDPIWVLRFFFKERFDMNNCYVCTVDGKVVSVLHAIKSKIKLGKETLNAVYIYGACTLSEYRSRGYMTNLLKFANKAYAKMGYECSFLVPESDKLIRFYSNLGYKNFFKIKRIEMTRKEMMELCGFEGTDFKDLNLGSALTSYQMENLRREVYENQCGVVYSEKDIDFAGKLYEFFSSGGIVSNNSGYGICGFVSTGELKVRDFTCKFSAAMDLLRKIYSRFPGQQRYIIETSPSNAFFKDLGECYNYGMIFPLSELSDGLIEMWELTSSGVSMPYLGISLE